MSILAELNPPLEGVELETFQLPDPGTITRVSGTGTFLANTELLHDLLRQFQENGIENPELENLINALEEPEDEAGYMVSLAKDDTGIDNTIFASTKGRSKHAARIKIAVDPPNSLNEAAKGASMALHDYSTVGEYIKPHLAEQVRAFIDLNRDALLDYWDGNLSTRDFLARVKPISSKK
jgi:hypothetical protein